MLGTGRGHSGAQSWRPYFASGFLSGALLSGALLSGTLGGGAFCAARSCSTLACRLATVLLRVTISFLSAAISPLAALSRWRASSVDLVSNCCRKLTLLWRHPVRLSRPEVLVQSSIPAMS